MKKYRIIVAYDGYDYQGWQSQPHGLTIADTLQRAYARAFGEHIVLSGASRTDAQVHALGQVAIFNASGQVPTTRMLEAWNNSLPSAIKIRTLHEVGYEFHPHHDVIEKTYLYTLFLEKPLPFFARYGWYYPLMYELRMDVFEQALGCFKGTHDFRSFCKLEDERSTVRTISAISMERVPQIHALQIRITGDGFLRFQVRRMIGAALEVARRPKYGLETIQDMLKNPNPQQHMLKAEPQGLCLLNIQYKEKA